MISITKTILQVAAPYEAVAFDVFDTLLKRDVGQPTDLFLLQGEEFARRRITAERQARLSEKREVTLAEIYAQPDMATYDPALECSQELDAAIANQPVLKAVRRLHDQGKRIYFVSDMYLPQEQIHAMLVRCGYNMLDGGFVSCSYGVQKRSGALFRRFLRETELSSRQVLFIGDNWRADVLGATLAGIRAWHLPAPRPVRGSVQVRDFSSGALHAFVQNRLTEQPYDSLALGFSILGPLEVAFCRWIHDQRSKYPHSRLYFLARDMYLTRAVYAVLYPEEKTEYLVVSRRSLCPALLAKRQYSFLAAALPRQVLSGKQIATYCGAACPQEWENRYLDLKTDSRDESQLRALLEMLQPPEDAARVLEYLTQSGLQAGDILVDIGSGGTTQMLLEVLCGIHLHGLQISGDERLRERFSKENTQVFLTLGKTESRLYWAGQPMLEKMISEEAGSTTKYEQRDGELEAVRDAQPKEASVEAMQRGACAFARDWQNSLLQAVTIPPELAIEPFLTLVAKPDQAQLSLLGGLSVEDGGIYPLANPRKLSEYFSHPSMLKRDLAEARWKIGFLARLLPLPFPYDKLYLSMRK